MDINIQKPIALSKKNIKATWLSNVDNYYIENKTIVINLGNSSAIIAAKPDKELHPMCSTILKEVTLINGDSLLLIEVVNQINIGGLVLEEGWFQLNDLVNTFPKEIPLWKGPQFDLGIVKFDPYFVTGLSKIEDPERVRSYQVKVNLWFATALTNCGIHNHHMTPEFLEVHTQINGAGRMQKFHANDLESLYQDVYLAKGETHIPFASTNENSEFYYPWHQYFSDTDCIWVANEFHIIN
ncbi:MAG: hypothetical protein ACKVOM_05025 [Ferruginibacter sp.]